MHHSRALRRSKDELVDELRPLGGPVGPDKPDGPEEPGGLFTLGGAPECLSSRRWSAYASALSWGRWLSSCAVSIETTEQKKVSLTRVHTNSET